jgi:NAD(P)H-nitrite reductase large subunit
LSECFGAGTGCGWCRPFLRRIFEEVRQGKDPAAAEPTSRDYARARAQYVRQGKGTPPPGATPIDDADRPDQPAQEP